MFELTKDELIDINGGGLTLVETLMYSAGVVASVTSPPFLALAVAGIVILEYQDYKNGI